MFNGKHMIIPHLFQSRNEFFPVYPTATRYTVPPPAGRARGRIDLLSAQAGAIDTFGQHLGILGMRVENPFGELAGSTKIVDAEPVQVRGIEVQSELFARNLIEQRAPQL